MAGRCLLRVTGYEFCILTLNLQVVTSNIFMNELVQAISGALTLKVKKSTDEAQLQALVAGKLLEMLRKSPDKVFQLLYRLDVNEEKARLVFKRMNDEDIAEGLSELIIAREKQKIEIRKKYSTGNI